jgi:hypothetical protein
LYHSTLGLRVIKKKKKFRVQRRGGRWGVGMLGSWGLGGGVHGSGFRDLGSGITAGFGVEG